LQFIAAKRCNSSGQCNQGGSVTSCGDGNLCTDDVCDNTSGCSNPNNSATQGCYTGPPATQNVGNCTDGVQTCSGGSFGGCANEVVPSGESCGGGDEDCDGVVDEENASGCTTYYYDNDGDSFGIAGDTKCLCTASGKYTATQAGDCNDGDSAVNPGATEACNSIDDDCDNATDEENATSCSTYYFDGDDDNYGTSASKCLCSGAGDYTTQNTGDCNDSEPMVNPAAPEFCNGIDDNCSSVTDEGFNLGAVCDGGVDADKCQEGTLQCDPLDPSRATCWNDGASLIVTGDRLDNSSGSLVVVNEAKTGSTGTGSGTLTTASGHDGGSGFNVSAGGTATFTHESTFTRFATSAKTCNELGWGGGLGSGVVCGESDNNMGGCSGLKTFAQAEAYCSAAGARLCTASELSADEPATTGCGYDAQRVWSSTSVGCGLGEHKSQAGNTTSLGSIPQQCTSDTSTAYVRCCADVNRRALGRTVSGWLKSTQPQSGNFAVPVSKGNGSGREFEWRFYGTGSSSAQKLRPYVAIGNSSGVYCTNVTIPSESWTHIAVTLDGDVANSKTLMRVYKNGSLEKTCTYKGLPRANTEPVRIGKNSAASSKNFAGHVDDVAMYGYALSTSQVAALYSSGIPTVTKNAEICDGADNNCTAGADESFTDLSSSCSQGAGGCSNSGVKVCTSSGLATQCSVTGKPAGTSCNDSVACTYNDVCTGGDNSSCGGTSYSCSGSCRQCDGTGQCTVNSGTCFIDATLCSASDPGCGSAASCLSPGDSRGGSGNDRCLICNPSASKTAWSPESSGVTCQASTCSGNTYNVADTCGGGAQAGTCVDSGTQNCDDGNLCTNDNCADATGCSNVNNSYQRACYTGNPSEINIGTCHEGIETCSGGSFGSCVGEVTPVAELCATQGEDGLDNNCDGLVDNINDFTTWYLDDDNDNHGVSTQTKFACNQPSGFAPTNDDCDDDDGANYPGNSEICDDQDNNCSNTIDENFTTKGDACDGADDPDVCAEGVMVCNAATNGVTCGHDGPVAAYTFDVGLTDGGQYKDFINEAGGSFGSAKTCSQLGWSNAGSYGSSAVCGETDASPLGGCSGTRTYAQAKAFCEDAGARLCTVGEVSANEPAGTGCGYDSQRIWTSSSDGCPTGQHLTRAGKSTTIGSFPQQCTEDVSGGVYVRCCADTAAGVGQGVVKARNVTETTGPDGSRAWSSAGGSTTRWLRIPTTNFSNTTWSLSFWYRPATTAGGKYYMSSATSTNDNYIILGTAGQMYLRGSAFGGVFSYTVNNWTHIVMMYDVSTNKITAYQDGTLKFDKVAPGGTTWDWESDLWIGQEQDAVNGGLSSSQAAPGAWDNISFYNHVLTDAQRASLYSTQSVPSNQLNNELCDNRDNDCKSGIDETFATKGQACSVGGDSECTQGGSLVCESEALTVTCSVTGKPSGTSCNDGNACTYGDVCSGGDNSSCAGTNYSCSGTCRSCNGTGSCTVAGSTCFITGGDPTDRNATGTCFNANQDPNGATNSSNSNSTSCKYCNPSASVSSWSNRPTTYACLNASCNGNASYDPTHFCNGGGSCTNPPDVSCNDGNVCTNDTCSASGGCQQTNNTVVYNSDCYTGPSGTKGVGLCKGGTEYCSGGGPSGTCVGQTTPVSEVCDGLDNDCDGVTDDGVLNTYYRDEDSDGYGNPNITIQACSPPPGYVAAAGDCVDSGSAKNPDGYTGTEVPANQINPGASEKCNDVDDNCSGGIDETFSDKGNACDGGDIDTCTDGVKQCKQDGTGTFCVNRMVWGTYGFSGGSTVKDISGFNDHASNSASHTTGALPPLKVPLNGSTTSYPRVTLFNGSNQYVQVNHGGSKPINISGPQLTMSAWIRWDGKNGSNMILNKESTYEIAVNSGTFQCAIQTDGGSGWYWTGNKSISANTWTHVACTYSRSDCKIRTYVNGVQQSEAVDNGCGNVTPSGSAMWLGRRASGSYFDGRIAATAVYDIKLSAGELSSMAQSNTEPFSEKEANYEFCDGENNDCKSGVDDPFGDKGSGCAVGQGSCQNSGQRVCDNNQLSHDTNTTWGLQTLCSVTGKANGASCSDGNACTYSDTCTGGSNSQCTGTSYSCSGACRSCNGSGGCNLQGGKCYIGGNCNPANRNCSGTCYDSGDDTNGTVNTTTSGNASCKYCNPSASTNNWSNRPGSWQCRNSNCSGLTFSPKDYCNGSGTCVDAGTQSCNDNNVCTNDSCNGSNGCVNSNNSYAQSCYTGPSGTQNKGVCKPGTKTCSGGSFGGCAGQVTPSTETCSGGNKDEDCDGLVNEEGASGCTTFYLDADQDGAGTTSSKCLCSPGDVAYYTATNNNDCNDGNGNMYPGNTEKCSTNFDDDCDGSVNEQGAQGCTVYYGDDDNDGYGETGDSRCLCSPSGKYDTTKKGDCNDNNSSIHPNATEKCNGTDDDCDGTNNEGYDVGAGCSKGVGQCANSGSKVCNGAGNGTVCSVTGKPGGTICYDGNNCTYGDVCSGGDNSSCSGTGYSCNDGKSCTNNVCVGDRTQQCSYPVKGGKCLISGTCYNNGNKQSGSGNGACKYCNSSASKTSWSNAPSSWSCRSSYCNGLTFHKTDYCGNGNGVCQDKGTENCNKGNVCRNYTCSNSGGCGQSNKGNGTTCVNAFCSGDTYYYKDTCQNGSCKDGGTINCNQYDNTCRNGYCSSSGCKISNYASGTTCKTGSGSNQCIGQTWHYRDKCNGSGGCNEAGSTNCNVFDNSCRNGYCSQGCKISNYNTSTKCSSGLSDQCSGATYYKQDYCNGSGSCSDKGSYNCNALDTTCRNYYCDANTSSGCNSTPASTNVQCQGKYCSGCTAVSAKYCNGSGSCSNGGGSTNCGNTSTKKRCSSGDCISSCSSNGNCCGGGTCINGVCRAKSGCAGACDDSSDCNTNWCINCGPNRCQSHSSGKYCYQKYGVSSKCGCSSYDAYNNCIAYHSCYYC
jgi:hypothetical protein